jgi:hypothetical protein
MSLPLAVKAVVAYLGKWSVAVSVWADGDVLHVARKFVSIVWSHPLILVFI